MPELAIQIRGAEPVCNAVAPTIVLHAEVSNSPPDEPIQSVLLNCQIQIEVAKRHYSVEEKHRLEDVFGEPERWGQTLRPLLWSNLTTTVPSFRGCIGVQLTIPCTFDFQFSAAKYFHSVDDTSVPVSVQFSGTIFYRNDTNQLQAAPIPWNTEARFAMPAATWKRCLDLHYPNTCWIALRRDNLDRLRNFQVRYGLATIDEAIEAALSQPVEAKA